MGLPMRHAIIGVFIVSIILAVAGCNDSKAAPVSMREYSYVTLNEEANSP